MKGERSKLGGIFLRSDPEAGKFQPDLQPCKKLFLPKDPEHACRDGLAVDLLHASGHLCELLLKDFLKQRNFLVFILQVCVRRSV